MTAGRLRVPCVDRRGLTYAQHRYGTTSEHCLRCGQRMGKTGRYVRRRRRILAGSATKKGGDR